MHSLTILAVLLQPAPAAIPAVEIRSDVFCRACRFVRDTVVILESDYAVLPQSVAIVGRDVFVIPDAGRDNAVRRFDLTTGRYLGTLSRSGGGPGELRSPAFLGRLPGDSLFVFDRGQQRFSIHVPGTYAYARGATVDMGRATAALQISVTGQVWVAAAVGSADQVGYPIHLFTRDGRWLQSTGPSLPLLRRDGYMAFARHLALGPDGGVWALTRYGTMAIEKYAPGGTLVRRFSYAPAWAPALGTTNPSGQPPPPERPQFAISDEHEVWVVSLVAARDWRAGMGKVDDPTHGAGAPVIVNYTKVIDSVIEVLDLGRGGVRARLRLDEVIAGLLPGGLVVLYREAEDGSPSLWLERWTVR